MPLESATHIADLNTSNPVGSTDKVQTLDDHVRLIKSVLKTDLNLAGAVTASHSELNILDGATLSTAELNILDGVTLTAAQINEAARLSAHNTFTGFGQTLQNAFPFLRFYEDDAAANNGKWAFYAFDEGFEFATEADAGGFTNFISVARTGTTVDLIALAATAITVNGVNVTDFARLSQAATFASTLAAGATTLASLGVTGAATVGTTLGVTGALTAATLANSASTTLVAGQLHFITGNATLPNLTAGQWIELINDSGSDITITDNGSDTTYWTATGASATSFTLAARGRFSAVCSPAGNVVYVSGNITAAS